MVLTLAELLVDASAGKTVGMKAVGSVVLKADEKVVMLVA